MMYALIFYCVASVGSALSTDWTLFLAWRVFAGAGCGAEAAIIAPFLSEFVAKRYRGKFVGALTGFFSFGFVGAALLGYFAVPAFDSAWRYVLAGTGLPILMLLWWRRSLPESPRWLISVGRHAEANEVVSKMESKSGFPSPIATFANEPAGTAAKESAAGKLKALWSPGLAKTTLMCWLLWTTLTFCYYSFFTWIPSLLVENGMTITKSFGYSLAMYLAQIPGFFSAAYMNEKIGRQATIVAYTVLAAIAAFGLAMSENDNQIMVAGILLSFFMNGTYAGVYAYTPEVYPTNLRATGTGAASSIGRIGAIIAPILVGWLYPILGFAGVFSATTVTLLVGAAAVLFLGVPTTNKSLEEIAATVPRAKRPPAKPE